MRTHLMAAASALAISTALVGQSSAGQSDTVTFEIEAKTVGEALQEFAKQSGYQMAFLADSAAGVQTRGISGSFEPQAALHQLLAGTGLEYRVIDERTIAILEKTEGKGSDSRARRASLQFASSEVETNGARIRQVVESEAQTVQEQQEAATEEVPEVEEIVVTGSRIERGEFSASVPVNTVNELDVTLSGTLNAEVILNTMPQFVAGGTSATNTIDTATGTGTARLDLRGLGAQRNLVMVNGRRWTFFDGSQVTDINTIPSTLIERVEVVTGGSSAVYGSDAIAGAVNFILKDDFEGVEARGQLNFDSRGDALVNDVTVNMGGNFGEGRGNAVLSVNYFKREPILQTERAFSSPVLSDSTDNQGNPILVEGGSSFVPNGRFTGIPTSENVREAHPQFDAALEAAGLGNLTPDGFIPDDSGMNVRPFQRPDDLFNYAIDNFLQMPQERWAVTGMADYDFSEQVTGYLEAFFTNNRTAIGFAPAFFSQSISLEVDNPFVGDALRQVFRELDEFQGPEGAQNDGIISLGINRRLVEVGQRRNIDRRNTWRILGGFRGDLGDAQESFLRDISYDIYYLFTKTENSQTQEGNVDRELFQEALLSGSAPNGGPLLNPFGPNISDAAVDFISVNTSNVVDVQMQVAAGNVSANILDLPAGPVDAVFGGEYRAVSTSFLPDQLLSRGQIAGFFAGSETQGRTQVWELFGETRVPLLGDLPFIESLIGNGAFRYSNYDIPNVDEVWTFLGGFDWRVSSDVMFRAQFQRAIRAPSVGELFGGQSQSTPPATDPCAQPGAENDPVKRELCIATGVPADLVGDPSVQPNPEIQGVFGGNPELQEERSDTWTFGAVITPRFLPGLNVTIDYFDIEVEDAIAPLAGGIDNTLGLCFNEIQDIDSAVCQAINRNPATGALEGRGFFVEVTNQNIGARLVSGVDLQVSYEFQIDYGLMSETSSIALEVDGTWLDEFTIVPVADLPDEINKCVGAFGRNCIEDPVPEFKTTTKLLWQTGPLGFRIRHRWIDQTKLDDVILPRRLGREGVSPDAVPVFNLDGEHYIDLSFTADLSDRLTVFGGVNNITDNTPPVVGDVQDRANTFPDTFDQIGAEIFMGATVKF